MTAFRDAFRKMIADPLKCPKCGAANRPDVYLVKLDDTSARAFCDVCSYEAPLAVFQPKDIAQ